MSTVHTMNRSYLKCGALPQAVRPTQARALAVRRSRGRSFINPGRSPFSVAVSVF